MYMCVCIHSHRATLCVAAGGDRPLRGAPEPRAPTWRRCWSCSAPASTCMHIYYSTQTYAHIYAIYFFFFFVFVVCRSGVSANQLLLLYKEDVVDNEPT